MADFKEIDSGRQLKTLDPGVSCSSSEHRPEGSVRTKAATLSPETYYPQSFDGSLPAAVSSELLEDPSIRLLVAFFMDKGLDALKQEDRQEEWYQDWIDYQARHGIYASLLSPQRYSSRGHRFDLTKLARFLEVFAYFSPAHAYSLHVSFLGLFPILIGSNEALKREAIAKLEGGGLFAFAVSEAAHGSDLFANEFMVRPAESGGWLADGRKYFIGNANAACIISILAKKGGPDGTDTTRRTPFVFFALRPLETPAIQGLRKIRTLGIRPAFVGEFEIQGHLVPPGDVISHGRQAWDAVFDTINLGKLFLGFGAVGICEHAFAEAFTHMNCRVLYGKPVTAMPHLRLATAVAFARLMAMKLYAYRSLDYLRASGADERRYLLFNAVQKAKVSTEGVKVMGLLSECIGARGFEAETWFEMALRDVQLIPGLEGSTHINFGLTTQFIEPYFAASDSEGLAKVAVVSHQADPDEDPCSLGGRDRNAKSVRFPPYLQSFEPLRSVANVRSFMTQVEAFHRFTAVGVSALKPTTNAGLLIALGKCFSTIAYGQLVAENGLAVNAAFETVSLMFHGLIEDLSADSLKLSAMFSAGSTERDQLNALVQVPDTGTTDLEYVSAFIAARYGA